MAGRRGVAAAIVLTGGLGHGPGSLAEAARVEAARARAAPRRAELSWRARAGQPAQRQLRGAERARRETSRSFRNRAQLRPVSSNGRRSATWASPAVVSLGETVDVDFGDCLDYFATDRATRAILLYVEAVNDARKFMSAARAAARAKPVVVIKSGRHAQGAKAAATAHRRARRVRRRLRRRVSPRRPPARLDLDQMFAAAETLGRQKPFPGKRLAVLTNGGGVGVLAVDHLIDLGGMLAALSEEALMRLDRLLPAAWSRANPVDIIGDADAARYAGAMEALLDDDGSDAVLVLQVPTALAARPKPPKPSSKSSDVSAPRASVASPCSRSGSGRISAAAQAFEEAGIPHFATEADAVQGFMHLVRYREAQELLMETPDSLPGDFAPDVATARAIIAGVVQDGRTWLDPLEANGLLRAYGVPVAPIALAETADEAATAARPILAEGGTVAVKVSSPDIVHKSDIGGVKLDLTSEAAVRRAALDIFERAKRLKPDARITGVTVQPMVRRPKARELIAGLADDPTFGPVVVFGRGGTAVEVINDKALALPPLDMKLAEMLIARTRVSRILKAYRDVPAADEQAVQLVLVKLAQLAADLPEVRELDINPILADKDGLIAVDARVAVAPVPAESRKGRGHPRFAIRPYPKEWEREIVSAGGRRVFVRPVRPEDEGIFLDFVRRVSAEDLRLRIFCVRSASSAMPFSRGWSRSIMRGPSPSWRSSVRAAR